MPTTAILCGVFLIVLGVAGYVSGVMSDRASLTALIPAAFGIALAGLGIVARAAQEGLRKHLMHAAVVVALLGFLATAGRLLPRLGELTASPAVISQVLMALICLVFVGLAVRSFIAARKARNA